MGESGTDLRLEPLDARARPAAEFRIVGIGASAGGLDAISRLVRAVPPDLDMALIVVMHLDRDHESALSEILGRIGSLPVLLATDETELESGNVYVIPHDRSMIVKGMQLRLFPRALPSLPQRPIDLFLNSLAEEHDGRAIGVVLSGTGTDGTVGLKAVCDGGGITFAQDASASHSGMPQSAVAAGCVSAVLSPEGIAAELVRISKHPSSWLSQEPLPELADTEEAALSLRELVGSLSAISGIDFLNYKQATIRRRIQRRIILLGLTGLHDYRSYFESHPEEPETLRRDILIRVTAFFRDVEVFDALRTSVFPDLLKAHDGGSPIRIWVPACATGKEVYSLAISLLEFQEERSQTQHLQIFGTDVSEDAIAEARAARYTERATTEVSPERLRRFFVKERGGYVIAKRVRDLCVFARQDATRDPPFSNIDLISCRNLLIYLGGALQNRMLRIFHYALRDGGALLLGPAESVGTQDALFAAEKGRHGIYFRRSVPRRVPVDFSANAVRLGAPPVGFVGAAVTGLSLQRETDRVMLARYAPPGVVIDEEMRILEFRGDTGAFLAPAPGIPNNELLQMAREGLLADLMELVAEGKTRDAPGRREGLRVRTEGREVHADLQLIPVRLPGTTERCFLILFEEVPASAETPEISRPWRPIPERTSHGADPGRLEQMEREIVATREHLRSNVERLETANESLRAANEEIRSSNEELYSTNEELQTAKEELQATNQELRTLNDELEHRNREIAQLGDDLTNLLSSVGFPIVMLGRDYRVRNATPSAGKVFGVAPSDVGKRLLDLRLQVSVPDLEELLDGVLETLIPMEREVKSEDGRWFSLFVRPYRTRDDKVDGAVLSLSDIDNLKNLARDLKIARDYAHSIVMAVREPLLVLDAVLTIRLSNQSFHETFGMTPDSLEGRRVGVGTLGGAWITPQVLEMLRAVILGGTPFDDFAVEGQIGDRGVRQLLLSARRTSEAGNRGAHLLFAVRDVTRQRLEEQEKQRLSLKVQETQRTESLGILAGGIAHDFNNILTAVLGHAELIQDDLPAGSPLAESAASIVEGSQRASGLCAQMLAHSGRGRFQITLLDLSALVAQAAALLGAMVNKKTVLYYDLAAELPAVEVDAVQIRQVLQNLVINASEAQGERGGNISVATGVQQADRAYLASSCLEDVPEGEYVYLQVADDGQGMSAESQARIFDPFFTTKFTGRGLGLAVVLGIVRGHRGALMLDTVQGRGSTFRILLPSKGPLPRLPLDEEELPKVSLRAGGLVLIVDDEVAVRAILTSMLRRLGFDVEEASDGKQAIEKFEELADRVRFVLLDLTMPVMGGAEAFERLRALRADLPIIIISGYDEEDAMCSFPTSSVHVFLAKPFTLRDLESGIRRALGPRTPDDSTS